MKPTGGGGGEKKKGKKNDRVFKVKAGQSLFLSVRKGGEKKRTKQNQKKKKRGENSQMTHFFKLRLTLGEKGETIWSREREGEILRQDYSRQKEKKKRD